MGLVLMLDPVALQGSQIISVAKFLAQLLEQRPIALLALGADCAGPMPFEILSHPITVQHRIVHVDQKYEADAFVGLVTHALFTLPLLGSRRFTAACAIRRPPG